MADNTPTYAAADASFNVDDAAFLKGTYLQVEVAGNGRFGTKRSDGANVPAGKGFFPNIGQALGFRADRDRDGTFDDGDFFLPGGDFEGWAIRADGADSAFDNSNQLGVGSLSTVDLTSRAASVVHSVLTLGLDVQQTYSVPIVSSAEDGDQQLLASVTITNNQGTAISDVFFSRAVDPDNNQTRGCGYSTTQTNQAQYGLSGSAYSLVSATQPDACLNGTDPAGDESYIGLFSSDARSSVGYWKSSFGSVPANSFVIDNNTTSFVYSTGTPATADSGIGLSSDLGSIAAGASVSFTYGYVLSAEAADQAAAGASPAASPSDSSATVTWPQGDSTGGTITGYRVRYSNDGGSSWATHATDFRGDSEPWAINITGLTNGTQYEFQVAPLTGDIDSSPTVGEWSASSSALIAGGPTAPTITSIAPGAEMLLVAFDTPSATGGFAITDYEYSTDNGSSWFSSGSTSSPITITGLTNGVAYSVKVRGKGSFSGVASAAVVGTPAASVAPFPPVISSIGAGNKSLTIHFTPPSDNGGAAISNYSYSTDGSTFRAFAPASTSSPASVTVLSSDGSTPLVNGTSYPISIKAINSTGASLVSNSVSGTPSAGSAATPAAPTARYRLTVAPPGRPIGDGLRIFRTSEAPEEPVLTVGGRDVELETTAPSNGVLRLDSSGFGFSLEAPGGSVTQNPGGKTTIKVAQERTAVLGGTGMQPNSRARAFLPLDGGNFVQVADIAVKGDGTFSGVGNFRNAPGKTPLPVGVTLLQLVSFDVSGNQIVVEVAVDIPQEDPRPEVDPVGGGVVELKPGKFQGSSAGKISELKVQNTGNGFGFQGEGYQVDIAASDDDSVSTSENGELVLKLRRNENTVVSGKGFKQGTRADVYINSEPTLVGSVTIDEEGSFFGEFKLDPELIPVGNHTLQVQGVGTDGYVKTANMGVVVEDFPSPIADIQEEPGWWWWLLLLPLIITLLIIFVRRTAKRQEFDSHPDGGLLAGG